MFNNIMFNNNSNFIITLIINKKLKYHYRRHVHKCEIVIVIYRLNRLLTLDNNSNNNLVI